MKALHKLTIAALAAITVSTAGAGGISGVLDGMFANVTAPNVTSNQFRGSISGGGIYVRAPISNIQLVSLDPPRYSIGCGGIDLYLGSFSFITADKLTQFIRNVAQNAAPLAFKMAIEAVFPQLGGVLTEFQKIAQQMNDMQRNSCQMAKGILSDVKNGVDLGKQLVDTYDQGLAVVQGWAKDTTDAIAKMTTAPSENIRKAAATKGPDGITPAIPKIGNVTWNALNVRSNTGIVFSITDDPVMSQQVLLSIIGTEINSPGPSDADEPLNKPLISSKLRLRDIFNPKTGPTGAKEVPIWNCGSDKANCWAPTAGVFATTGIDGFVRKYMYGNENAVDAQPDSIVYKMTHCTSGKCGMNSGQLAFLNAIGKIPAIGMMMHAQSTPSVIEKIAPELMAAMVDEISILYAHSVIDIAITTYSNTELTPPADFNATLNSMREDLKTLEESTKQSLSNLNTMATFIDTAMRSYGSKLLYRPH